jgi:hypothetical protein
MTYKDMRNSYQAWRDREDAKALAAEKLKEDTARATTSKTEAEEQDAGQEAEKDPPTVEGELSALRGQVATLQQELEKRLTPRVVRSKMTDKEKAAYIGEHGTGKYFQLPWD